MAVLPDESYLNKVGQSVGYVVPTWPIHPINALPCVSCSHW